MAGKRFNQPSLRVSIPGEGFAVQIAHRRSQITQQNIFIHSGPWI